MLINLQLKQYQDEKVEELKNKVNELLELDGSKLCIFEAPTGSGKTIMVGEFLKRLVNPLDREDGKQFSFIWISVRDLHNQSKKSLGNHFENVFRYSSFEDLQNNIIGKNEILFLNWEKIYNKDRIYIRDNEKGKNLSNIVENTKQTGREIILIVDESHHTNLGPNATRVRADISAKITLEVSATPVFRDPDGHIKVHFEKVVAEGMIKKEVAINLEFQKIKVDGKKIAVAHFPKVAKDLAQSQKYDLVFYGHTHCPHQEKIGKTELINSGNLSNIFYRPSFAVYDTQTNKLELKVL